MENAPDQSELIEGLVRPAAQACGCELWSARLSGGQGNQVLKVVVDAAGGVDVERCARVARALEPMLEDAGFDLHHLEIQVSSPGAERPLRGPEDYRSHIGQRVHLRYRSGETETVVEGKLIAVVDESLVVESPAGVAHEIEPSTLVEARLAVTFGSERPPKRRKR